MKHRKLPLGVTESRTQPWFRYSRGQHAQPRYFYYGSKGAKAAARRKVIAFANQQNKTWTPKIAAARKNRKSKSNQSGAVGVSIKTEKGRLPRSYYYYWWARWPGCPSGIKFSILEHKDNKAFCLAQIARELESQDRNTIGRTYEARRRTGKLRALLAQKRQDA